MILEEGKSMKEYPMEKRESLIQKAAGGKERGYQREIGGYSRSGRGREVGSGMSSSGGRGRYSRDGSGAGVGGVGQQREGGGSRRLGGRAGGGKFPVFIGNISYDANEEDLKAFLEKEGKVERVSLVYDPRGRSKGFGFADMLTEDGMHGVIEKLDGKPLFGRVVAIREGKKTMFG